MLAALRARPRPIPSTVEIYRGKGSAARSPSSAPRTSLLDAFLCAGPIAANGLPAQKNLRSFYCSPRFLDRRPTALFGTQQHGVSRTCPERTPNRPPLPAHILACTEGPACPLMTLILRFLLTLCVAPENPSELCSEPRRLRPVISILSLTLFLPLPLTAIALHLWDTTPSRDAPPKSP
jgi:hypothetical protein